MFALSFAWGRIHSWLKNVPACHNADFLFALRILPLMIAVGISAAFTVPSFLIWEPRAIVEPVGPFSLALGLCGAAVVVFGLANLVVAISRAWQTIAEWTSQAQPVDAACSLPVLRIARALPPMTAVGILRPRILFSTSAEFLLDAREMQTALNHEIAHIRRRDNLKKLLLRAVVFPGMRGLESAWLEATEMAADDAAVSSAGEALDLAAALIKLSRLAPLEHCAELAMSLVHGATAVNHRVERLIHWTEQRRPVKTYSAWYAVGATLLVMMSITTIYSELLMRVHTATEWLIR